MYEKGSIIESFRVSDLQVGDLIGRKVVLKPEYIYGTVEAVKLGYEIPQIKISGEWYDFNEKCHLVFV